MSEKISWEQANFIINFLICTAVQINVHILSILDKLQGVWKCGQTLSWVFDISSQLKLKLRRKQRNKIVKISAN